MTFFFFFSVGDMEFKQNKFLPPEKQIVTANPDVNIVGEQIMAINCFFLQSLYEICLQ
jgi:hypothetical protein